MKIRTTKDIVLTVPTDDISEDNFYPNLTIPKGTDLKVYGTVLVNGSKFYMVKIGNATPIAIYADDNDTEVIE